jgi:hypothetical protein
MHVATRSILFSIVIATCAAAQTADTAILGTISDSAGAVLPGATVTVSEASTGFSRTVTTNPEGYYEVRYLVPGGYSVDVKAGGFREERRTGITIQIGQQARLDFALQLGTVQQTLEVHSEAPLLQTENATLAGVVAAQGIQNLPLNGANLMIWRF